MRSLRLLEAAAQAEKLRLTALLHRSVMRVVWVVIGLVFGAATLTCLHVVIIALLLDRMTLVQAALLVGGTDLLITLILIGVAWQNQTSATERAALAVRQDALAGVKRELAFATGLATLTRLMRRFR
jgi:hypothetical protein